MKHAYFEFSGNTAVSEPYIEKNKAKAWEFFRTFAGIEKLDTRKLQDAAQVARHGGVVDTISDAERADLYVTFRRIFSAYATAALQKRT